MNFQVELTSLCNLTCGYCPNRDMQRVRAFMDDDVFETILSKYIVPYRNKNRFTNPTFIGHKDGEILLVKKAPDRLRAVAAAAPDMSIDVYSHGMLLPVWKSRGHDFLEFLGTLPNRCRYLMSYHPHNHDGSVNDYTATNAYMKEVLRNPPRNVEFIMVAHVSRHNTADMVNAWRESWREEIARGVLTVHANVSINAWTGRIDEPGTVQFHGCPYGDFGHMFFGATGNVIACCLDLEEEIVFGNVMTDEPAAIIDKLEAFYADQRSKVVKHAVCNNCHGLPSRTRDELQGIGLKSV